MSKLHQFKNCMILRDHQIIKEDFWVRDGKIQNPEKIFFEERIHSDVQIDCRGLLIVPGYIDAQINGGFSVDFSDPDITEEDMNKMRYKLLSHGVTSFLPTVVTSPPENYKKILPKLKRLKGGRDGAATLGCHLEGPFISVEKRGAHLAHLIQMPPNLCFQNLCDTYGDLSNVSLITMAPELHGISDVIRELCKRSIIVSVGHSMATLSQGEDAVRAGATFITHLFNAMPHFHHRDDPHLVGLLASSNVPTDKVFYGIIADGIHAHDAALRIAYRVHPRGCVLVTDAMSAMGLGSGVHTLGEQTVEIKGKKAVIAGTDILCGSIANLDDCVRIFRHATGCSVVEAIECATLHPAQLLHIEKSKGTLSYCADADFLLLDEELNVQATYIAGECVWRKEDNPEDERTVQ